MGEGTVRCGAEQKLKSRALAHTDRLQLGDLGSCRGCSTCLASRASQGLYPVDSAVPSRAGEEPKAQRREAACQGEGVAEAGLEYGCLCSQPAFPLPLQFPSVYLRPLKTGPQHRCAFETAQQRQKHTHLGLAPRGLRPSGPLESPFSSALQPSAVSPPPCPPSTPPHKGHVPESLRPRLKVSQSPLTLQSPL